MAAVRVAADGTGHYCTVQDAIDAVPLCNAQRVVIHIAAGVYRQAIYVPKSKNHITLCADSAEDTILTWSNTATSIEHHQVAPAHIHIRWQAHLTATGQPI